MLFLSLLHPTTVVDDRDSPHQLLTRALLFKIHLRTDSGALMART